jgi:hypothetical protein
MGAVIAPEVTELAKNLIFGRLGKAAAASATRTNSAVDAFMVVSSRAAGTVGRSAAKASVPLASKVLSSVSYGPAVEAPKELKAPAGNRLLEPYRARTRELMVQVAPDQTGKLVMRPDARAKVADRLGGVAALSPLLADQMETMTAR